MGNMLERISLDEFRKSGALWWVNQQLHIFGMALVLDEKDDGAAELYPAKCKFRGFNEAINTYGYKNLTNYISEHIEEIKEGVDD